MKIYHKLRQTRKYLFLYKLEILFAFFTKTADIYSIFLSCVILFTIYLLFNLSSSNNFHDALWTFPSKLSHFIKLRNCIYLPSMTNTVEPTSPSCIIIEPAGNVTGYMQSTISRICVSSKFFMKSLSSMAVLISSRDLEKKRQSLLSFFLSLSFIKRNNILRKSKSINKEQKYNIKCISKAFWS